MLTKRLAACAAQVTPAGVVCDVGTDHAYLPAELLQSGRCTRAVATDIHAGPLEAARRTLTEAGVLEQAELRLRACHQRFLLSKNPLLITRVQPWARSPKFTITCVCCLLV